MLSTNNLRTKKLELEELNQHPLYVDVFFPLYHFENEYMDMDVGNECQETANATPKA